MQNHKRQAGDLFINSVKNNPKIANYTTFGDFLITKQGTFYL
jgi:hypothetical protein